MRRFSAFSKSTEVEDSDKEGGKGMSLNDRLETSGGSGANTLGKTDVPIPVCALAACRAQPLLAVGVCHGVVHIMFVKQVIWSLSHYEYYTTISEVHVQFDFHVPCWVEIF